MFGLFGFLKRSPGVPSPRRCQARVESLEPRMLLSGDVPINSTVYDTVTTKLVDGVEQPIGYAGQQAATNIVYDPAGSDTPTIVSAYQNEVMTQFAPSSNPYHLSADGTSISTDGGNSFNTPLPDTPLPDGPLPSYYGDGGNATLARDPTTGNIFLATTSDIGGHHTPDIQVFESTNGGQSFSAPMDATPGFSTSAALDKPWIVVGSDGKVWLTFLNLAADIVNGTTINPGIYLTSYAGTETWPTLNYGDNPLVDTSTSGDLVHGPQVVLDSSNNPYVIYYRQSEDGKTAEIDAVWNGGANKLTLATLHPDPSQDPSGTPDMMVATGDGIPIRAEYFPSVAYGSATNQIYVAFADRDSSGIPHVNILAWNLNSNTISGPQEVPIPNDPLGQGEAWNPSIAISPDGGSLFVGFYGLPDSTNDDVYVYGATGTISASGSLTMNDAQQLSASSFQPANTPEDGLRSTGSGSLYYYWGDNDNVSADYDNFYYSHMETSSKTFDVGGTPTAYDESDVYLSTVPIPYSDRLAQPAIARYSVSSGTVTLKWDTSYSGLPNGSPNMYAEYSTSTQPWTPIVFTWTSTDPSAAAGAISFGSSTSNFNYNSSTIYYFRLRAQYPGGILGSSTYSDVLVFPGTNAMVFNGTTGDDRIVLTKDSGSNSIDFTLNDDQTVQVSIISGGSLLVLGGGGSDHITFDLSNGNFLTGSNTIDNDGGSLNLKLIGTSSADAVSILGGGSLPYIFDGTNVNAIAGLINTLEYDDGGGNDTIGVSGYVPTMLNLSTGNTTVTSSDSAPVYVVPGTGKINLTGLAGTSIIPAVPPNTTTPGIRNVYFSAINISDGAKVMFADTGAIFGDLSNHANRTLAIVDAGGLNIASGGVLDINDNSMLLKYDPTAKAATDAMINSLLTSGYNGGQWNGTGIMSSEASYNAFYGSASEAVGWADQYDVGVNSFEGDSADVADGNEIMIKFTYYGDTDLNGTIASSDSANFSTGVHLTGNAYWEFGDFDYSGGKPTASDSQLFSTGLDAYQNFGQL